MLQKAAEKLLSKGQKLMIVVDALDEADKSGQGNLLDLPKFLPENVYFFLTRRYYQEHQKRLYISEGTYQHELDLMDKNYQESTQNAIEKYIKFLLYKNEEYRFYRTCHVTFKNRNVY